MVKSVGKLLAGKHKNKEGLNNEFMFIIMNLM